MHLGQIVKEICVHMCFGICLAYAWPGPAYARHMLGICPAYAAHLLGICRALFGHAVRRASQASCCARMQWECARDSSLLSRALISHAMAQTRVHKASTHAAHYRVYLYSSRVLQGYRGSQGAPRVLGLLKGSPRVQNVITELEGDAPQATHELDGADTVRCLKDHDFRALNGVACLPLLPL